MVTSSFSSDVGSGDWDIAELPGVQAVKLTPVLEVNCVRLGADIKPSQVDVFQVSLAEQQ